LISSGAPLPFWPFIPRYRGLSERNHETHRPVPVLTNIAVVAVLGIVASLLGVNRYLTANGLNLGALLGFRTSSWVLAAPSSRCS
jgi:hypothetical protein